MEGTFDYAGERNARASPRVARCNQCVRAAGNDPCRSFAVSGSRL